VSSISVEASAYLSMTTRRISILSHCEKGFRHRLVRIPEPEEELTYSRAAVLSLLDPVFSLLASST
jgi:hypothetical protein